MKRLGIVCGGASYHHRALNHPKYRRFFHEHIYLLNFPQTDLSRLDGLLIPERFTGADFWSLSRSWRCF